MQVVATPSATQPINSDYLGSIMRCIAIAAGAAFLICAMIYLASRSRSFARRIHKARHEFDTRPMCRQGSQKPPELAVRIAK